MGALYSLYYNVNPCRNFFLNDINYIPNNRRNWITGKVIPIPDSLGGRKDFIGIGYLNQPRLSEMTLSADSETPWADPKGGQGVRTPPPWDCQIISFCHV